MKELLRVHIKEVLRVLINHIQSAADWMQAAASNVLTVSR